MKPYGYVWTSIKDCMETRFTRMYPNEFYKPFDIVPVYTHPVKELELFTEIEALKEVNAKQVDYIAEQKSAYEKLWAEHMELFWKHEKDTDLTNE